MLGPGGEHKTPESNKSAAVISKRFVSFRQARLCWRIVRGSDFSSFFTNAGANSANPVQSDTCSHHYCYFQGSV